MSNNNETETSSEVTKAAVPSTSRQLKGGAWMIIDDGNAQVGWIWVDASPAVEHWFVKDATLSIGKPVRLVHTDAISDLNGTKSISRALKFIYFKCPVSGPYPHTEY